MSDFVVGGLEAEHIGHKTARSLNPGGAKMAVEELAAPSDERLTSDHLVPAWGFTDQG
jgi:hypothetical protein